MSNLRSTGRTPAPAYTTNGCPRATAYNLTHPYLKTSASLLVLTHPYSSLLVLTHPLLSLLVLTPPLGALTFSPPHASCLHPSFVPSLLLLPLFLSSLPPFLAARHLTFFTSLLSTSPPPSSSFPSHHPFSIRSEFTHLLSAAVFRVRHAPRPKGFTNRRRATTLPLPALLRRAPAVRRTRAWPFG